MKILVVGAGFSGAVVARSLAEAGHDILVVDERPTPAGNCHTARDAKTGIMLHLHGPHIFHTGNARVWDYVRRFAEMVPYRHRVKAQAGGRVYSLPINLHTINQVFEAAMTPDQARAFIAAKSRPTEVAPRSFKDQALAMVGDQIYRAFLDGYTRKQWGVDPSALPAAILKRLPLRFSYDDSYFDHPHQAIPRDGYTDLVTQILDHPGVELRLGLRSEAVADDFAHTVYSGPLDRYFDGAFGRLSYRTLDFERIDHQGDYQGVAVMNYCDADVPFTRISEHKHFAPWERFDQSVCFREFSRDCGPGDSPYYPLRLADDDRLLSKYVERAKQTEAVTFVGRLGTYSYLDMDVAILRALETAEVLKTCFAGGLPAPAFVHAPI